MNQTTVEAPHSLAQYQEPPPLRVFRLMLISAILLASFVGNYTVLRGVIKSPGRKSLTYCLVFNLALAELISTSCIPFLIAYMELTTWPFGELLCHVIHPLQVMAGLAVTSSIAIVAGYRCLLALRYVKSMPNGQNFGMCLLSCVWLSGFIIALPSYIHMTTISPSDGAKRWCLLLFPGDTLTNFPSARNMALLSTVFVLNYGVSGVVIICSYAVVISSLFGRKRIAYYEDPHQDSDATVTENRTVKLQVYELSTPHRMPTKSDRIPPQVGATAHGTFEYAHNEGPNQDLDSTVKENRTVELEVDELSTPHGMPTKSDRIPPQVRACTTHGTAVEYELDILRMFYAIVVIFVLCYLPYQVFFLLERCGQLSWNNWRYFDITRAYIFVLTCVPSALHPFCYGAMSKLHSHAHLVICCVYKKRMCSPEPDWNGTLDLSQSQSQTNV